MDASAQKRASYSIVALTGTYNHLNIGTSRFKMFFYIIFYPYGIWPRKKKSCVTDNDTSYIGQGYESRYKA